MRNTLTTILVLVAALYGVLPDFFHSPWDDLVIILAAATLIGISGEAIADQTTKGDSI
jgi:hypothetical protein